MSNTDSPLRPNRKKERRSKPAQPRESDRDSIIRSIVLAKKRLMSISDAIITVGDAPDEAQEFVCLAYLELCDALEAMK